VAEGDDAEKSVEDPDEERGDGGEDEHDGISNAGDDGVELCIYVSASPISK